MKKLKFIIIGGVLALLSFNASAQISSSTGKKYSQNTQNSNKSNFKDRLVFGGGLNGGLHQNGFTIGLSPKVGYRILPNFYAGVGVGYLYSYNKRGITVNNIYGGGTKTISSSMSIISGSIWSQYKVFNMFLLHGEFEVNNWDVYYKPDTGYDYDAEGWRIIPKKRITVPSLLLGGGLDQPISRNLSIYTLILYDVLQENTKNSDGIKQSPYAGTVDFRVGVRVRI